MMLGKSKPKTTSDGQIYQVTSTILAGPCLADRRLSFSVKSTGNLRATSPNKDKKKRSSDLVAFYSSCFRTETDLVRKTTY